MTADLRTDVPDLTGCRLTAEEYRAKVAAVGSVPGVRIADVVIGDRARKDYGDLTSLMESIKEHGLLQPIGVLPGNRLLFGGRRLEACRRLGWESIPYTWPQTRDDALSLIKAERDENTCRKDMTPEELVDVGLKVEEIERPNAEARQAKGIGQSGADARWHSQDASGSREPDASNTHGRPSRTAIEVGAALDMGAATYKRAKHVVQVARGEIEAAPEVQAAAVEARKSTLAVRHQSRTSTAMPTEVSTYRSPLVAYGGSRNNAREPSPPAPARTTEGVTTPGVRGVDVGGAPA